MSGILGLVLYALVVHKLLHDAQDLRHRESYLRRCSRGSQPWQPSLYEAVEEAQETGFSEGGYWWGS